MPDNPVKNTGHPATLRATQMYVVGGLYYQLKLTARSAVLI